MSEAADESHGRQEEDRIAQLAEITALSAAQAADLLQRHGGDLNAAMQDFFQPGQPAAFGTTLPETNNKKQPQDRQLYAGGGKSGLAIIDPRDRNLSPAAAASSSVADILALADQTSLDSPATASASAIRARPAFSGVGNSVSGASTAAAAAAQTQSPEAATSEESNRRLTFWANGFQVERGPLLLYSEHEDELKALKDGHAPRSLFDIPFGSPLNVHLEDRQSEQFIPPKPLPFSGGGGSRLGAPLPAGIINKPSPVSATANAAPAAMQIDESQPTTSVQVRLPTGAKLTVRMNKSQLVSQLRRHVMQHLGAGGIRLQTTFPTKDLEDDSASIEAAGLCNAVVVARNV